MRPALAADAIGGVAHQSKPEVFLLAAERIGVEAANRACMGVIDVRQNGWGNSSA